MDILNCLYTLFLVFAYTTLILIIFVTFIPKSYYKTFLHILFKKNYIYPLTFICYGAIITFIIVYTLSFIKEYPWIPDVIMISGSIIIILTCFVFTIIFMGWIYAQREFMDIMACKTQNDKGVKVVDVHASV